VILAQCSKSAAMATVAWAAASSSGLRMPVTPHHYAGPTVRVQFDDDTEPRALASNQLDWRCEDG
jgi:hypothetical protein